MFRKCWMQHHFSRSISSTVRVTPVAPWRPGVMAAPWKTSLEFTPRSAGTTPGFTTSCPPTTVTWWWFAATKVHIALIIIIKNKKIGPSAHRSTQTQCMSAHRHKEAFLVWRQKGNGLFHVKTKMNFIVFMTNYRIKWDTKEQHQETACGDIPMITFLSATIFKKIMYAVCGKSTMTETVRTKYWCMNSHIKLTVVNVPDGCVAMMWTIYR